ncbi:MAG: hypothetical protein EXX96DRAFT_546403 [Benjaminiella poitrasii]|nr:MAG: hypothetical protein EXX96DRAFT_546403 [Benjaminiella poitrasii]
MYVNIAIFKVLFMMKQAEIFILNVVSLLFFFFFKEIEINCNAPSFLYTHSLKIMPLKTSLPGAFPNEQSRKTLVPIKSSTKNEVAIVNTKLRFRTNLAKLKHHFHNHRTSWQSFIWKKKKDKESPVIVHNKQQHGNTVGSIFNIAVPISISNTTHYYASNSTTLSKPTAPTSVIQQWIVLPPLQVYGFMALIALFLLVVAFGILQIHRTISILQIAVDGVRYSLVGLTSNSIYLIKKAFYWF